MGNDRSNRTPLPPIDRDAVASFWARFTASFEGDDVGSHTDVTCFGDSVELADELLTLVIEGPKRATAGSLVEYEAEGTAVPSVGDRWIACDGSGRPRAVLRTTDVRVGPLSSVDEAFAWDEGEGDRTRADWLRMHRAYFRRTFEAMGERFDDDIAVVFERFAVDYVEDASGA